MSTENTNWQDDWPEHTEAIDKAIEALVRAIDRWRSMPVSTT